MRTLTNRFYAASLLRVFAGLLALCVCHASPAHAGAKKSATGTIDTAKLHQEIAGFGASEAYYQGFVARNPHSNEIYDALFGPENGLHTDFLRLQNRFRYLPDGNFDKDAVEIVKHANALRSSPMTIIMSSWSPPASLKSNHDEKNGGTLARKNGHFDYAGFAQYWRDSVVIYRALGVDPTYVSIQNEPDESTDYESCRFNPSEAPWNGESNAGYAQALDAVYRKFQELPSPPRLLGPETIGIGYGNEQAFEKSMNPQQVYAVTHHDYTGGDKPKPETYIPAMQAIKDENRGRLLFQTEYYTEGGFETAEMIHYSLAVEEVNLYLYWPYAWPATASTMLTVEDPADPGKWKNPHGWGYTDGYFAMKQYSYFIHSGYHRVEARSSDDDMLLSAYLSGKGDRLVVVAINTSANAESSIKLKLGAFAQGKSRVVRTSFPNKPERFAELGSLSPDGLLTLPAHSVATVEIIK